MGLTKFVLKRPVTVLMVVLCLLVFGISSVFNATLEQMPDTDQPMMIVSASYSGTGPEDMDELVTQPLEDAISRLEGIKSISSTSSEGRSRIMLEYDYDQDMDAAYDDLKKALNNVRGLPSGMDDPSIMEMSSNAQANITISISHPTRENLYDYVDQKIVPEFEKLTTVAEVSTRGGNSEYIRAELKPEMMKQYGVTVNSISSAISGANLTYPSGTVISGNQELNVTTSIKNDTLDDLLAVPITTSSGKIIYLEDVADVYYAERKVSGMSRYNGEETISLTITKQQQYSAMDLSRQVKTVIEALKAEDEDLKIEIARDEADSITRSLKDVAVTMGLAVGISMLILFLFLGDYKASLIVGSSIPLSILVTLIIMTRLGFTLNIITMSGLVLSVGMMVDNSIVTLESCFRARERTEGEGALAYAKAALSGSGEVTMSIIGSTLTTCVVFLPLVFLSGMAGQMFGSLGWVIVISMAASLLSAMTVVPLTYMLYKPRERRRAPLSPLVRGLVAMYRRILPVLLKHKIIAMLVSVAIVAGTYFLANGMETELMTSDDTGTISVNVTTRPGLLDEKADGIIEAVEKIVSEDENVDSYMIRFGGSSGSATAYLKDERTMPTDEIVEKWERAMADIDNCTITVSASGSMSFMGRRRGYQAIIQGTRYEELQEVSARIVDELIARDDVMNVHSSIENTAPVVSVSVDAVAAGAEGLTASQIGSQVRSYLTGTDIATLTVNGNEIKVTAEYPDGEYNTVPQMERLLLSKNNGQQVALSDVAEISYKDSPSSISKYNKEYQVTISADYVNGNVSSVLDQEVILPNLTGTTSKGTDSRTRMMNDEFSGLYRAIAIAAFLVFVVLSAQFESMKFAFMVMTTIPFSLVGSFTLLKLTNVSISMTSLIGFLILVGTVVNNGILYVDTVNQYRIHGQELLTKEDAAGQAEAGAEMQTAADSANGALPAGLGINEALIEAGATRLRPILMTSLTTILAMIPMAAAYGNSGATTQGLAIVDIGGLAFGVLVALFLLPVYYALMNRKKELKVLDI